MADKARFEGDGDVGIVTLDSPPLNLFGDELTRDIGVAFDEAEEAGVRALLLRADGKVFTGGADVHVFEGRTPAEASQDTLNPLTRLVQRLEEMPFPTLSSVHALCLTAGFELSLGCDLIFAAESARFGLVERVVGLTPGAGGTQRVAERAGPARAREFVMSGDLYDAATLERWNVINRVLPDDELREESLRFARTLAEGPTLAHAATKRMVRAFLEHGVRGADERIGEIAGSLFGTEDLQNAVKSFLEHGGPGHARFHGR
ncbi:MAG: enoyl-CoA hydratase/isomerase family protein [Actinobacteria bacterium]|nr:MAG: enoyl-CoA hydratase/isomerase family protein [Actinomycetota bacterium]TMM09774.1 MAG: enoyl-CoA hydratase/isomerase family protein [Actinomycetota bacterium]